MVIFKSPPVAEQDFNVVLKHFWHVTHGIFIWEYVTTFGYEWDVIRGHRPYRWTIWIYSLTRAATLIAVILDLIILNVVTPIKCQVWITFDLIFCYVGLLAASVLIGFRVVAIWNKNKFIVGITAAVSLTNVGVIVLGKSFSRPSTDFRSGISYKRDFAPGIVRIRSEWDPLSQTCFISNPEENMPNIIVIFISDVVLLVTVLVGLLIMRHESGIVFPLGNLLWNQGIIWLAIATVAEAPPVVFIILNLNHSWNVMFQFPSLITMSIAATRMYRSLSDFVSGSTDILSNGSAPRRGHDRTANTPATTQINRIEVAVDVAFEQHLITCTGEQLNDESHKSKFGNDLESAMENRI